MNEETKKDQRRTSGEDRSAADVKADDPKRSLDRLVSFTRKILKVPKAKLDGLTKTELR